MKHKSIPMMGTAGIVSALFSLFAGSASAQESQQEPRNELEEDHRHRHDTSGCHRARVFRRSYRYQRRKDMDRDVPFGLVDTLKAVPGLFVQESGGQTSNSIGVRGLPSTAQLAFISVQEDGLPVNYERYHRGRGAALQHRHRARRGDPRRYVRRAGAQRCRRDHQTTSTARVPIIRSRKRCGSLSPTSGIRARTSFMVGPCLKNGRWPSAVTYMYGDTPRENGFNGERGGEISYQPDARVIQRRTQPHL